jgi:hypothetical protein
MQFLNQYPSVVFEKPPPLIAERNLGMKITQSRDSKRNSPDILLPKIRKKRPPDKWHEMIHKLERKILKLRSTKFERRWKTMKKE